MHAVLNLIAVVLMATPTLTTHSCPCYTASTTIKPLFCERSVADGDLCDIRCLGFPTTTITISTLNPTCPSTETTTKTLPCCGGPCPTITSTVVGKHTCERKTGVQFGDSTSFSKITALPYPLAGMNK